ncbi:MAG TPA: 16S rRNA (guanine(527)-N(7))-methyltransferase RsmG [bacterium]|nr:16S rRNA (guanine(527)-N(7))-methyltransferase RsmG [bacterium]
MSSSLHEQRRPIRPSLVPSEAFVSRLRSEAAAVGVALADQHAARLIRYLQLIQQWRRPAGLTAVADPFEAARVHIADSLLCLRAGIVPNAAVMDVGSGAGLPGIPLAIVRSDLRITLLEAEGRKAAFLEMAVRELSLSVEVVVRRAEEAAHDPAARERYDAVVARAVAPLRVLFELTLPFAQVGGVAVLLKGPGVRRELRDADRAREILGGGEVVLMEAQLSGGEGRRIVVIPKVKATPAEYPRRPGIPARRPL